MCFSLEEAGAHDLMMTFTVIQKTRVRRVGEGRGGVFVFGIYARLAKVGAQALFENARFGEVAPALMRARTALIRTAGPLKRARTAGLI